METREKIQVRQAEANDLDAISEFIQPFVADGTILRRTLNELRELIPYYSLALLDEKILGCVVLEIYSPKLAEIRSLAVSPEYQGLGIGKLLVHACIEHAKKAGVFEVMAITSRDAFFQSCGFDFTLPGEKKALFYLTRESM